MSPTLGVANTDVWPREPSWRRHAGTTALVAAIALAGLVLRLPRLGDSLFGDEVSTYYVVAGHGLGRVLHLMRGNSIELNPPLYFLLAWFGDQLGHSSGSLRLVSLLAGTVAIPLTYLVGRRTVGRPAAMVGAALVALSPFPVFFSNEARPFELLLALTLGATLCLLNAVEGRGRGWWAGYAACACATVYTQYTGVFVVGALFVWAYASRPASRRPLVVSSAVAAAAFLPWLPRVLDDVGSPGVRSGDVLTPFNAHTFMVGLEEWAAGRPFQGLRQVPGHVAAAQGLAGVAVAVAGLLARRRTAPSRRDSPSRAGLALVVLLALAAPVCAALYSAFGHSIWDSRQLSASWPGLALLTGALLTAPPRPLRIVAVGLVLTGAGVATARALRGDARRPDYEAAARFVYARSAPGDPIVDVPLPTPGPLTGLDAALERPDGATPQPHPVFRLGGPSRAAMVAARPYARLTAPPPGVVMARAVAADRRGRLFAVMPAVRPARELLRRLLPRDYHLAAARTFRGFVPLAATEYRRRPSTAGR